MEQHAVIKKIRYIILFLALILATFSMSFAGALNYMTFAKNYNIALVNTFSVAGNEIERKIEYALHYGKPIDNYYGMSDTLWELKDVIAEIEQVKVVSLDGNVLYDLDGFVTDTSLSDELLKTALFHQGIVNDNLSYQYHGEKTYVFIKINDINHNHLASLGMVFPEGVFLKFNSQYTKQLATYLIAVAFMAIVVLFAFIFKIKLFHKDNSINKKKLITVLIIILGSSQLFYSGINYYLFKNAYLDNAYKSKAYIENIVAKNIESVYIKGLSLQDISGLDDYLYLVNNSLPQIEKISLVETKERVSNDGVIVVNPQNNEHIVKVTASISSTFVDKQMHKILLDMLTVCVISIFFMIELTLLAMIILMIKHRHSDKRDDIDVETKTSHGLIRTLIFLVNICVFMSITFVPIVMQKLYTPVLNLPKDVVLGLPLSAEMLGSVLAIILSGALINKKGWRAIFYTGALFLAAGNLFAGLSVTAIPFIISRLIAGLGIGFILMALRSLVVSLPEKNTAIAQFAAGSLAGLNCGAVIGGMLSDRIGYEAVFCIAAASVVILFIFVRKLMNNLEIEERTVSNISPWQKLVNFICDKKALVFLICIFIPFFISGAFLDYFFPLFALSHDLSQSDISRAFLLNGLCIIYLGPLLTRFASNRLGEIRGMVLSIFIVVCALTTFVLFGTVTAAFVTIILLGIAESFGLSMKTSYFLNLKGIKDIEINKGIAYFSVMVSVSRMAGPIVFGVALSYGMKLGLGMISLGILVLLIAFIMFTSSRANQKATMSG